MAVIDNIPDPVKETYLRIRSDHGKKLELKFIGGNYYLYIAKGVWDKKRKKPVKKTVLFGSIDANGTFTKKEAKRIFSPSSVYEYGNSQLVWNLCQEMYRIIENES